MTARLAAQHLVIGYPGRVVAANVSLQLAAGEIVAVLGASGSGKSTLLTTIAGVTQPLGGTVLLDGTDVTALAPHLRGIGLVFQEPLLFPHLSVGDNVGYGLRRNGVGKAEAAVRVDELLTWLDLPGYRARDVSQLSGGQAQRVALARALAPRPRVLLLDEPFSALDTDLRSRLVADVAAMLRHEGVTAIHVTHDAAEGAQIADRVVNMSDFDLLSDAPQD